MLWQVFRAEVQVLKITRGKKKSQGESYMFWKVVKLEALGGNCPQMYRAGEGVLYFERRDRVALVKWPW